MMRPLSSDDLAAWRIELDYGVEFRDKEFGTYRQETPGSAPTTTLAGKNLDYFEQGARTDEVVQPPLNIVFPIVKNVVPTLLFQNPRVNATPEGRDEAHVDDAFYVSESINQDLRDPFLRIKETAQTTVFDGYLLANGLVKIGYATEFGADILPTKTEERQRLRDKLKESVTATVRAVLGQPQPVPEPEPEPVAVEESIRSESAYIRYINPFDFVIDPRARDITEARWVAQRIRRTLSEIKRDRRYGRAKYDLTPEAMEDRHIPESAIEDFQTADVWEVHFKTEDSATGIGLFTMACTQAQTVPLMQPMENIYDIGGWQYEWLTMNKHGHRLYPVSTISIIRPLVDRMNSSLDVILEQLDKFSTKIAFNERVSAEGELALDDPSIGARVKVSGTEDVRGAIAVISMEQVKGDILGLINQIIDFVILITGLTRAQLTGLTTAQTATEAQIGQSGQNLRRTDEANTVADWFTRVITKYWRVKAQFQDLTETHLVQETTSIDPATGLQQTQWYPPIDQARADRLKLKRFRFGLDVYSMQKPNLEIIRAQFTEVMRAIMEPIVTNGLALEGKRVSASEALRQWSKFFQESGLGGFEKIIVPINDPMLQQNLLTFGQKPTQTGTNGSRLNGAVPTMADQISAAAGEKGQGASPV